MSPPRTGHILVVLLLGAAVILCFPGACALAASSPPSPAAGEEFT